MEGWINIEENEKFLPIQQDLFHERYSVSTEVHFKIAEPFLDGCEAQTIQEAKDSNKWIEAINEKLESLEENKT